eukprot:jgi/Botrbrau1/16994/Bobra.49_2s0053.1
MHVLFGHTASLARIHHLARITTPVLGNSLANQYRDHIKKKKKKRALRHQSKHAVVWKYMPCPTDTSAVNLKMPPFQTHSTLNGVSPIFQVHAMENLGNTHQGRPPCTNSAPFKSKDNVCDEHQRTVRDNHLECNEFGSRPREPSAWKHHKCPSPPFPNGLP